MRCPKPGQRWTGIVALLRSSRLAVSNAINPATVADSAKGCLPKAAGLIVDAMRGSRAVNGRGSLSRASVD